MPEFTDAPVDWNDPQWGHNPVHVASFIDAEGGEDQ